MLDGDLFDKLATIAQLIRKNKEPFGGIQLIITGDFFQLPPVMKTGDAKFAFEAQHWKECVPNMYNLTQVFRQKDESAFAIFCKPRVIKLTGAQNLSAF